VGTTNVVRIGLGLLSMSFMWIGTRVDVDTSYLEIVGQMVLLGAGLGATTAPATESIMGSLSTDKAGIGSAVNDTTRELGGTLGVAIIGSVFSSVYIGALDDARCTASFPGRHKSSLASRSVRRGRSPSSSVRRRAATWRRSTMRSSPVWASGATWRPAWPSPERSSPAASCRLAPGDRTVRSGGVSRAAGTASV
jgi:hypothetical protein